MAKTAGRVNLAVMVALVVVVVMSAAVGDVGVGAEVIDYASMNHDHVPGTKQLDRPDAVANKYSRGCESEEHCKAA
uniref:Uncharacterized protein n=1 Tax=Oryza brachyantha TaxID=4533 RepID=J3MJM6_ORYBR